MTQHNFSCPIKTCRKSSRRVWESVIYSWTHAASVHVQHLDWVSHGWPGNTLNTLQGNGSLFSLANTLLQQEDHHLPGRAELCSLSDLDRPEGKTNDHNLSCAQKTQRIWQEHWKRLKLLQFNKICISKFPLWRICGLGIWSVLTAQAAETLVWLISQCKLGCNSFIAEMPFRTVWQDKYLACKPEYSLTDLVLDELSLNILSASKV